MLRISKRGFTRIIAFSLAIITALLIKAFANDTETINTKRLIENYYMRCVGDLSRSLENIKNTLNKGMYSNSPLMMNELSSRLGNDAMAAKMSLSALPLNEANLINIFKFLSQAGNYSKSLSHRAAMGDELTLEDRENIAKLYDFAVILSENVRNTETMLQNGLLTFDRTTQLAYELNVNSLPNVTDGFMEIEDSFADYPMLIYDGPFSDHIMQKEPLMTKNMPVINSAEALEIAVKITGNPNLSLLTEEAGRMPSYVFADNNTSIAITKSGGFLSYMLDYRTAETQRITAEQAIVSAKRFLGRLGITDVIETYHETRNGICIINFAGFKDNITLYTELIKVGVAMDTGEVVSADARGWLVNREPDRIINTPLLSEAEAREKLSPLLTIENAKLALIPSDGMNEIFCYEFKCRGQNEQQILVYINAVTGAEEQIFLLEISRNGVLVV
jgi:germination protein YpeB